MPAINLAADELAAVTEAIRRLVDEDKFPHAPRLDPLRAALGKFVAAAKIDTVSDLKPKVPPAKGDKRKRR